MNVAPYTKVDQRPRAIKAAVVDFDDDVYVSMFWHMEDPVHDWSWLACLWRHEGDAEDVWQYRCRFKLEGEKNCYGAVYRGSEADCRQVGYDMARHIRSAPPEGARLSRLRAVTIEAKGDAAEDAMLRKLPGTTLYITDDDGVQHRVDLRAGAKA